MEARRFLSQTSTAWPDWPVAGTTFAAVPRVSPIRVWNSSNSIVPVMNWMPGNNVALARRSACGRPVRTLEVLYQLGLQVRRRRQAVPAHLLAGLQAVVVEVARAHGGCD